MSSIRFMVKARDVLLSEEERGTFQETAVTPRMSCKRKLTFYDSHTDTETPSPMVTPSSQPSPIPVADSHGLLRGQPNSERWF